MDLRHTWHFLVGRIARLTTWVSSVTFRALFFWMSSDRALRTGNSVTYPTPAVCGIYPRGLSEVGFVALQCDPVGSSDRCAEDAGDLRVADTTRVLVPHFDNVARPQVS